MPKFSARTIGLHAGGPYKLHLPIVGGEHVTAVIRAVHKRSTVARPVSRWHPTVAVRIRAQGGQ